jgi:hypothetical protein
MRLKRRQYVRHSKYGWGTILERSGNQTTVYFRTIGIKRLATSSANFAIVGGGRSRRRPSLEATVAVGA